MRSHNRYIRENKPGDLILDGQELGRLNRDGIRIHSPEDFEGMRRAGRVVADILDRVADMVAPGVSTGAINNEIEAMTLAAGATSATIGYKGYQHASCISVNHVVCHGIPGNVIPTGKTEKKRQSDLLLDGDILNIDVTVIVDGWYGDFEPHVCRGHAQALRRPAGGHHP